MAEVVKIANYQGFIDYAFNLFIENKNPGQIIFTKGLDFHIKIKGANWDGRIDYRTAEYVLNFQKSFISALKSSEAFKDVSPDYLQNLSDSIIVKFTIAEGSTDIQTHIAEVLKKLVDGMTGKQKILTVAIIASACFGSYTINSYFGYRDKIETAKLNEKTKIELIHALDDSNKNSIIVTKTLSNLINRTKEGDTLYLPILPDQELTSKEAKAIYSQKRERSAIIVNHIDDRYMVTHLSLEEPQEFIIKRN